MTMDMLDGETEVRDYALERLIMLSDGVFAIAMTLLALEIRPPEHWDHHLESFFVSNFDVLFAFLLSFGSIAGQWAGHRRSFGRFKRADFGLSFYSLVQLGLIVLVPAATKAVAESHYDIDMVWLYVGLFWSIGVVNCLIWCPAAFFSDILKAPATLRLKIVVALMVLAVAPAMTSLGVLSSQPTLRWTLWTLPVIGVAAAFLRRWADHGPARPPEPA